MQLYTLAAALLIGHAAPLLRPVRPSCPLNNVMAAPVLANPTPRDSDVDVRKALLAQYAAVTRAFQRRDIAALMSTTTPDYVAKQPNGQSQSRAQIEADFKQRMAASDHVTWSRKIEKLEVAGDTAVATVSGQFRAKVKLHLQGPSHRFAFDALTKDTWVRADGSWKLRESDLIRADVKMDGKPFGPPGGH